MYKIISHKEFVPVRIAVQPSERFGGVGLFAICELPKGTIIAEAEFIAENEFISWEEFRQIDEVSKKILQDFCELVSIRKRLFCPNSSLLSKFNPRNIRHMPADKFIERFDLEQNISFPDGHELDEEGLYMPGDMNYMTTPWYMNHCCDGNTGYDTLGNFVTIKAVFAGEELCYDYALAVTDPKYRLKCICGSANCRKIITGNDWKSAEIMNRYRSCLHPLMREELEKLSNSILSGE